MSRNRLPLDFSSRRTLALGLTQLVWGVFYIPLWQTALALAGPRRLGAVAGLAVSSLLFAVIVTSPAVYWRNWRVRRARWTLWALTAVSGPITVALIGLPDGAGLLTYLAVEAVLLLRAPWSLAWVGLIAAAYTVLALTAAPAERADLWSNLATCVIVSTAVFGSAQFIVLHRRLHRWQRGLAELAVDAERGRIARDLHDELGATLTGIAVKAELAGALLGRDEPAARSAIADIGALAHSALERARQVVGGLRRADLAAELATARDALAAARVDSQVAGAPADVAAQWQEVFAWGLREGITNVIRHAGARRVWITFLPDRLVVADDGPGAGLDDDEWSYGLVGLSARAATVGARVQLRRRGQRTALVISGRRT
ncbi:MAG: histidine kinase [Propionibacteriaceae bacterium]|nr:histidine kinase [Propionibacteriaceae bacterium]